MKKLATLIATSALATAGVMVAPMANAAEPYPQSVTTVCAVATNTPVKVGTPVRARVNWVSAGNARPSGKVKITVIRKSDGKVVRTARGEYAGKPLTFKFSNLKAAGYRVRVVGTTAADSVFKGCSARGFVRVKR